MFEGLVRQLIVGYLGQYIKDIQREQLKITLWNEEVLLENVELILEAFDYLQLPFSLKQGFVGRLSIKIPWKKLGWDPIIITLEDVFIRASQRDDHEWSTDAVERREFAAKKAKLAAAELAKLSRRVCDNRAGQSFASYITAKILDGIQVSIRNVCVQYHDKPSDETQSIFGIKLSSLTMKQNITGGRVRGGQVSKILEIQGLEVYCGSAHGTLALMSLDFTGNSEPFENSKLEGEKHYVLPPFDVSMTLLVSRTGRLENDIPQYSVKAEIIDLVLVLDEVQLQRILSLWDYLCTCQLREKYGRFRPWNYPLSKKHKGWQKTWWHYAQQSVLSDVHSKLKKTSWKYLGERMNWRRKYVNLYKSKLECFHEEQVISDDILNKLEQMEKETDIDDILSFRSSAETELQELLKTMNTGFQINGANVSEKAQGEDRPLTKNRGWLNWLSLGVLGAGGTDDSSQFSGVVSDDVIKDIFEATEFHYAPSPDGIANGNVPFFEVTLVIRQISFNLRSMKSDGAIAEIIFDGMLIKCKLSEEHATVDASTNCAKIVNPNKECILLTTKNAGEKIISDSELAAMKILVDISSENREAKVILQPIEIIYDSAFVIEFLKFYDVLTAFKSQHDRVLLSFDGIEDAKTRIVSKAEYLLSNRKSMMWNFSIAEINIAVPWITSKGKSHKMVLNLEALLIQSIGNLSSSSKVETVLEDFNTIAPSNNIYTEVHPQGFYEHFEIEVKNFEVMIVPDNHYTVPILEKLFASIVLASCIISDSCMLQLKVNTIVDSLCVHFSSMVYAYVLDLLATHISLHSNEDSSSQSTLVPVNVTSRKSTYPRTYMCSIIANLKDVNFHIDLESDKESNCSMVFKLQDLDIKYALLDVKQCIASTRGLKVIIYSQNFEKGGKVLCSSGEPSSSHHEHKYYQYTCLCNHRENSCEKCASVVDCFFLHYEESRKLGIIGSKYALCLKEIELHCYPYLVGLLVEFSKKLQKDTHSFLEKYGNYEDVQDLKPMQSFSLKKYSFSNFFEADSFKWAGNPLQCFPFVRNTHSFINHESSNVCEIPEWSNMDAAAASQGSVEFDILVDLSISRFLVQFHDSSCTIATINVPSSRCSILISDDCFDILCSMEGLVLTSSWWNQNIHNFLWGPRSPHISSILNTRTRNLKKSPTGTQLEMSFSIQNVLCTLPPEFLAVIIGYFSLPDWSFSTNEQPMSDSSHLNLENESAILYKVEILDTVLLTPAKDQFLSLQIPKLFCSFIPPSIPNDVLEGIPDKCSVDTQKIAEGNYCLNVFGHDLSLSLLLNDDGLDASMVNQDNGYGTICLIAPINTDLWVRIPYETEFSSVGSPSSTCIMVRITSAQIMATDYLSIGFGALMEVIDHFSTIDSDSKCYTSDIEHFLHIRKTKDYGSSQLEASATTFTEIKCCVDLLSVRLCHLKNDLTNSEEVAKADIQFTSSASLRETAPLSIDTSLTRIELFSGHDRVKLAESISSVDIHFSPIHPFENQIHVSIPSLDVWLHIYEWTQIIDVLNSFNMHQAKIPSVTNSVLIAQDIEYAAVDATDTSSIPLCLENECKVEDTKRDILIVKLENVCVKTHVPIWMSGEAFSIFSNHDSQGKFHSGLDKEMHCNFIVIDMESRYSEIVVNDGTVKMKVHLDKVNGELQMCKENNIQTWPFIYISHLNIEWGICENKLGLILNADILFDTLDVWLSYHIFYFWQFISFKLPEGGSSEFMFKNIDLTVQLRKISIMLTDGRWSSEGHLLEMLIRDLGVEASLTENKVEILIAGDLRVNYNNINKVLWEPFVEPWKFQLSINRMQQKNALLNSAIMTTVNIVSIAQLNLNVTEFLIEAMFRTVEMIKDAWGISGHMLYEPQRFLNYQDLENVYSGRYAPYILQNLTSLPLLFHVLHDPIRSEDADVSAFKDENLVQPGISIPIYIDETPEERLPRYRSHSSDRINDKQFNGIGHHYVVVQFYGTSRPSSPISMDRVGLSCIEIDFSKTSSKLESQDTWDGPIGNKNTDGISKADSRGSLIIPIICEVSVQRCFKMVQLYSTVILYNTTSVPFEIRFDIPIGVSPKILDPVYPGQKLPLPVHLAEAGQMRWRPLGQTYLWSEANNIANILFQENRAGFQRSFVWYPSHPSNDPFWCCISVQHVYCSSHQSAGNSCKTSNHEKLEKHCIHQLTLCSPLVVKNCLPKAVSLTVNTGGVSSTTFLQEVDTSFFHIDSSHDLDISIHLPGFNSSSLKFPRTEVFTGTAKFSGTKFSLSESIVFFSEQTFGPIRVSVEKIMDAFSGAREIYIYVPFLLYNCTGFSLSVLDSSEENKGHECNIPSCYDIEEQMLHLGRKDGVNLLTSYFNPNATLSPNYTLKEYSSKEYMVSTRMNLNPKSKKLRNEHIMRSGPSTIHHSYTDLLNLEEGLESSTNDALKQSSSHSKLNIGFSNIRETKTRMVEPCMYSPSPSSVQTEIMVRVSQCSPKHSWSSPFPLVPPTGSANVIIPQFSTNAAHIVSVTSSAVVGPFAGRTRVVTFQPRYLICNACTKDLFFKQKATNVPITLGIGKHSHIQWTDTTRDLLISIRFNEPGWQWSGSFLPEHLGDTQVKMRNYVSGALKMIRVEVQNVDVSIQDEKIIGNLHENSGTNLVLLSDDDTGFMPYRIDNFSKERLRVYQQKCEAFETIVHSYSSSPYAWDEPCYPHRLTVEVPGERVIGSYSLDDMKEFNPVHFPSSSEKPQRTLFVSIHAEGAIKVLSIVDASSHSLSDAKFPRDPQVKERKKDYEKPEASVGCREMISISIPFIGVSLMNAYPQELVFASAKNITIDILQNLDQQKFSFTIQSLQIDNQLQNSPYPVILSFDRGYRRKPVNKIRHNEESIKMITEGATPNTSEAQCEPALYFSAAKWRNDDNSLVSFEYISLRTADICLEIEQEVILGLLDFFRLISSRSRSGVLTSTSSTLLPFNSTSIQYEASVLAEAYAYGEGNWHQNHSADSKSSENYKRNFALPLVVPIGAPWQRFHLFARRKTKLYVEVLDVSPIMLTLSFSSTPWMLRNGILTSGESLIHRGLMALADVEGAQINLRQLTVAHQMASWESIQEIFVRHYARQFLHEIFKVFGSAGVIGNPMGFARNMGLGIRDFLSAPVKSVFQSPTGILTGMAQGTSSLLSNTVYAVSDAATQFSRAAHKGIVAFTYDDQSAEKMEKQQKGIPSHSKGVINEFLEGLTGLLQTPIKEAEKHGLAGVVSGFALGVAGVVARPTASILEVAGKTAQSIRNRSKLHQTGGCQRLRVRLPRPLSRELPLMPYSWEEAIGAFILAETEDSLVLKDETLVLCKPLKPEGKFTVFTEKRILVINCLSLANIGNSDFPGVPASLDWMIEAEILMDSIIHADSSKDVVHIVGSSSDPLVSQNHQNLHNKQTAFSSSSSSSTRNAHSPLPFYQTDLQFAFEEDANESLQILFSTIESGKERGWGRTHIVHQINLR
ncbi:uncharacterized protein LOC124916706 [Impatiens glandulifera]|uniref:uncharacterized protein LOC124916706 n=1 Tax=Impatiens glandulifera TaxID=253017 RepID=UPI001FB141B2|nr:uncharacterized protein LOC124916706 [Impatiens glandulifera]